MPKVMLSASLVRYAKIAGLGWRRGSILSAKNGRVKPDAMLYAGKTHSVPADSPYQIRHYQSGKAVYATVGTDYDAEQSMLEKFRASRQLEVAHNALGIILPKPDEVRRTVETFSYIKLGHELNVPQTGAIKSGVLFRVLPTSLPTFHTLISSGSNGRSK